MNRIVEIIKALLVRVLGGSGADKVPGPSSPVDVETPEPVPPEKPSRPPGVKTMNLEVLRYSSQGDSTLGILFDVTNGQRKFLCYTLEDEYRTQKVYSETRIPAGEYEITLRLEGGHHLKYSDKFGSMHKGMLWIRNVPNFEYILIHIGNKDEDTAGCLLVGNTATQNITEEGMIGSSTSAYKRVYPPIAAAILAGEKVKIRYVDHDTPVQP